MRQKAHDLGNQLTISGGQLELAHDAIERAFGHLKVALQAEARAKEIVRDMLSTVPAKVVLFDANSTVKEVADQVRSELGRAGVKLTLDLCTTMVPVVARELSIFRAVVNLVRNAMNASIAGGELVLRTRNRIVGAPETSLIEVSDSGSGMSAERLSQVWQPHETADGLHGHGLSFVKDAMTQLGGRVELRSVAGNGTVVQLFLPQRPRAVTSETEDGTAAA